MATFTVCGPGPLSAATRRALEKLAVGATREIVIRKGGPVEADIETTIVDAMVKDGWRAFKMQYSFDQVKKLTLGEPGMCDHLFVRYGLIKPHPVRGAADSFWGNALAVADILWWEYKASKKRRKRREFLSVNQTLWIQAEKRKGALVWVAGIDHEATIAGAAQHYLESGLCRRRELFLAMIPPKGSE